LFSTHAELNWLQGEGKVKTYTLPGTRHMKGFCSECSSALPNVQMDGKLLVVPAGSLDTAVTTKPNAHIFCASRASWEDTLIEVMKFETFPS
jgi:hypothetical protein